MPRPLKPQLVKKIEHPTLPIFIDVMLDKNKFDFFFQVNGDEIQRFEQADAAIGAARIRVKEIANIEWEPVIEICYRGGNSRMYGNWSSDDEKLKPNDAEVSLYFKRFERGRLPGGEWKLKRKHYADLEGDSYARKQRDDGRDQGDWFSSSGTDIYIPYTEKAWHGLESLVLGLHDLHRRFNALLQSQGNVSGMLEKLHDGTPLHLLPALPTVEASPVRSRATSARGGRTSK